MRNVSIVAMGLLLSAVVFSSCTCHKEVAQPEPSTFNAPPSGFHVAGPKITPHAHIAVEKVTPIPETPPARVAAEPASTPPADVPADFPEDVPILKDAAVAQVQNLANDARNVIFSTAAALPDVYQFYQDRMEKQGWKVMEQVQRKDHAFIQFKKGDWLANVTIAEDVKHPGKQLLAIMYEQEKPLPFEPF